MRPRYLECTAIGSFPDTVEIDFQALGPHGLFHIHGPTGSGKSSLLDAMCFALYGTVPSPRRADSLRSHHARPATEARVSFDFSAQEADWRVVRTPTQLRAKLRGSGTTEQRTRTTLFKRIAGKWAPVASSPKEVDSKVRDLIGLDADQFMQVVVLPQGAVQEALRAGAEKRRELLSTLFNTSRFSSYADHLTKRAKSLRHALDMRAVKARAIFSQIVQLSQALELDLDWPTTTAMLDDDDLIRISHTRKLTGERARLAAEELSKLQSLRIATESRLQEASVAAERTQRLRAAREKLALLDQALPDITIAQKRLDQLLVLAPAFVILDRLDVDVAEIAEEESLRDTHCANIVGCNLPSPLADELVVAIDAAGKASFQIEALRVVQATARKLATTVNGFVDRHRNGQQLQERLSQQRQLAEATARHVVGFTQRVELLQAEVDDISKQYDAANALASEESQTRKQLVEVEKQRKAIGDLLELQQQHTDADATARSSERAALDARALHLELFERYLDGIASELASELREGEPCSVCGSHDHPRPAIGNADPVTRVQVEKAATDAEKLQQEAATARDAVDTLSAALHRAAATAGTADGTTLEAQHKECSSHLRRIVEAAKSTKPLHKQLIAAEQGLAAAIHGLERAKASLVEHETTAQITKTELDKVKQKLAETFGTYDPCAVGRQVEHLLVSIDALMETTLLVDTLRTRIKDAQHELDKLVRNANIASIDQLREARTSDEDIKRLRGLIGAHHASRVSALSIIDELEARQTVSQEDLQQLTREADEIRQQLDVAIVRQSRFHEAAKTLEQLERSYLDQYIIIGPAREECDRVTQLAELCAGVRTNETRVSLERYVLAAYLEEIAAAASARLQIMTSGRYTLRHNDARVRGNAASGLSLLVCDAFTGQEREVSTLSGGETFLASLAFALGLADVVQNHAGGVAIEALFIDEGFGSLDPETLDLAMAELDRLREGGRLVGVISHVSAMRDRIPAGIEVVPSSTGSRVVVHC